MENAPIRAPMRLGMGVKLANRVVFTSTGRDYHFPRQRSRQGLTAKVIKCDAFWLDA